MFTETLTKILLNNWLLILGLVILVAVYLFLLSLMGERRKFLYKYKRRECVMTEYEKKLFDLLQLSVGNKYYVFPQIHLPTLLEHKIVGQNWKGAFHHINQKSVDFVLCDKVTLKPLLAIELDDRTHERPDRQERDKKVEDIFMGADMPLYRLTSIPVVEELVKKINLCISNNLQNTQDFSGKIRE
jgi:hypothetical protein